MGAAFRQGHAVCGLPINRESWTKGNGNPLDVRV